MTTVDDGDAVLVEPGDDHVVDHPAHDHARRDGAEGEHERAGDGDEEGLRLPAHHRADEGDVLARAVEAARRSLDRGVHGSFLPAGTRS